MSQGMDRGIPVEEYQKIREREIEHGKIYMDLIRQLGSEIANDSLYTYHRAIALLSDWEKEQMEE